MAHIQSVSRDGLVVCASGGKEYKARDAIDAALFRGELEPNWKEFLSSIKAEKRAEELELELEHRAIESAAELFRYEQDLITAAETEQWLSERALTLEDFSDYFTRQYWRSALDERIVPDTVDFVSAPAELRQLFIAALMFSGELDRLSEQLMWRLAALAANGQDDVDPERIGVERQQFINRNRIKPSELGDWLGRIGRDEEWLEETLAMEAAYRRVCETVLNPQARKKQLAMLRLPLTQFEAEVIEVESRDAAREALYCIREDGMSMEEVAAEARYPYRRVAFLHQDIPSELQQKFWSVGAGDVLEPFPRDDGFELYRITKKTEPELDDAAVQRRIDERLRERHFSALASKYVEARLQAAVPIK
jgi:hypothetical protein